MSLDTLSVDHGPTKWAIFAPEKRCNRTKVVEDILSIPGGFLVEVASIGQTTIVDHDFYTKIPIKINDTWWTIVINGNQSLIEQTQFAWRQHPFRDNPCNLKKMIPNDIVNWMSFILTEPNSISIIETSDEFWSQLRHRIPKGNPLSLL